MPDNPYSTPTGLATFRVAGLCAAA